MNGDIIDGDNTTDSGHRITKRIIGIGGMTPVQLLEELGRCGVRLNDAARTLLAGHRFPWSPERYELSTVELSVRDLGLVKGAGISDVRSAAAAIGLLPPPVELAPYMRLQYLDQPEGALGFPAMQHRAPPGSVTIASEPLSDDDDFPKGFYLRRIDGVLWLRGYMSGPDHIWNADDRLVFIAS
ncbi:MAG TPA: helicase [Candidatus Kapabacteria bacterium]|nr:helicase [Candidatus Kapabacteria bacterium]